MKLMKAAVMRRIGGPLSIEDVPVPKLGPDDVLIETRSSGICGTDLHILAGHGYVPVLPHILGHEPAGVVVETGRDVSSAKPGDRVVPHLFFSCNRCRYCRSGRTQQCENLRGILGVLCPGAFAEYFKVPSENLFVLPDSIPFDAGGLIADAVVTGVHAVRRAALKLGDSAVVVGAGGVGQIIIQLLSASGVQVTVVDRAPEKLRLTSQFGAVSGFAPDSAPRRSAECVFDCVGTPESIRLAADLVMRCGRIVVIGEEPGALPIETTEIAQGEIEIIGSRNGTRQDMADAIRLVSASTVRPFIAARFPLDQINDAFHCVREGALGRVVIVIKN